MNSSPISNESKWYAFPVIALKCTIKIFCFIPPQEENMPLTSAEKQKR